MNNTNTITEIFGDVISSYSRAQAIEDGFLCDISPLAKDAGFKYPVAISSGIHSIVNKAVKGGKDYKGVIWDILSVLLFKIKMSTGSDRINLTVKIGRANVQMYSVCSGGDNGEPVITVMLPNED